MSAAWQLEMPARLELISANDRLHWAVKNNRGQALRKAAWALALKARIPQLERVTVTVEYQPPMINRKRDADNLAPSGKYLIDGLVDAKVLPDDNKRHVTQVTYRVGDPFPGGRLVLHVEEAS